MRRVAELTFTLEIIMFLISTGLMVHVRFSKTLPIGTVVSLVLLVVNFVLIFAIVGAMQSAKMKHGEGAKQREKSREELRKQQMMLTQLEQEQEQRKRLYMRRGSPHGLDGNTPSCKQRAGAQSGRRMSLKDFLPFSAHFANCEAGRSSQPERDKDDQQRRLLKRAATAPRKLWSASSRERLGDSSESLGQPPELSAERTAAVNGAGTGEVELTGGAPCAAVAEASGSGERSGERADVPAAVRVEGPSGSIDDLYGPFSPPMSLKGSDLRAASAANSLTDERDEQPQTHGAVGGKDDEDRAKFAAPCQPTDVSGAATARSRRPPGPRQGPDRPAQRQPSDPTMAV